MRRLGILTLLLSFPINVHADNLDTIGEIVTFQGKISRDIPGDSSTIIPIQNFEYLPGWMIYVEYILTTNTSSYFNDITYANTMRYRSQMGTLINALDRVELTNNSFQNDLHQLNLLGDDKLHVYLSAEIIPDTRQGFVGAAIVGGLFGLVFGEIYFVVLIAILTTHHLTHNKQLDSQNQVMN